MTLTQASEGGLKISNAGSDGQFLQKQSGNTGGLTWATPADTNTQVGGATGVDFNDDVYIRLGTGNDLKIWHNAGANSYIRNESGNLLIEANSAGDDAIKIVPDGSVELYYDNSKKFETDTNGVTITGQCALTSHAAWPDHTSGYVGKAVFGAGDDLQIYHNGTYSFIKNATGSLTLQSPGLIQLLNADASEYYIEAVENGAVSLYYDNSKKAYTYSGGWKVDGYIKALANISDSSAGDNTGPYHHIQSDSETNSTLYLEHSGDSTPRGIYANFSDAAPDNATQYFLYCEDNSAIRAKICANGSFESADNSYGSVSDVKLKENIVDANSQWDDIKALKIRNFNFKRKPDTKLLGVVAQEVETISPGLVYESEDLEKGGVSKGTTTKGVKYSILYMKAIKALQEAITKIETLETKVAALEAK